jgi:hypothetical protein
MPFDLLEAFDFPLRQNRLYKHIMSAEQKAPLTLIDQYTGHQGFHDATKTSRAID